MAPMTLRNFRSFGAAKRARGDTMVVGASGEAAAKRQPFRQLFQHARLRSGEPAIAKDLGIWQTWSWSGVADRVRALACGLAALGCRRGDRVAVIGDNRPHLYMALAATQCLGGIRFPCIRTQSPMKCATSRGCRSWPRRRREPERVDKLLDVRQVFPGLAHIVSTIHEAAPLRPARSARFPPTFEVGRQYDRDHPGFFEAELASAAQTMWPWMLYTSGTTGRPKESVRSTPP